MGREGERERSINVWETHQLVASHMPSTRDLAYNPAICPHWDSVTLWFTGWRSIHWVTPARAFFWLLLRFLVFTFVYQQLHYVTSYDFLGIYPWIHVSLFLWIAGCSCFLFVQFEKIFTNTASNIFFCPFLSSLLALYLNTYTEVLSPYNMSFQALLFFFQVFFFLCFNLDNSFWKPVSSNC